MRLSTRVHLFNESYSPFLIWELSTSFVTFSRDSEELLCYPLEAKPFLAMALLVDLTSRRTCEGLDPISVDHFKDAGPWYATKFWYKRI